MKQESLKCLAVVVFSIGLSPRARTEAPPVKCSGGESFRFEIQGSVNAGAHWASNSVWVYGRPGSAVQVAVRTRITIADGATDGWSFSLRHDDTFSQKYGGSVALNSVTTTGAQAATVKDGEAPDLNVTAIRPGFNGYTQGV